MQHLFKDKNYIRLCLAAFLMSSCLQFIGFALPFVVKNIDGSDTEVGLCFMSQMGIYVIFCLINIVTIDRFNPKLVLIIGAVAQIFISIGFLAVVWCGKNNVLFLSPVMQLFILMAMVGVITAFFWPVMMGWISTGYEGAELTKRFGFYNVTWASANMIMPVIAGYLMELDYRLPIAVSVVTAILCLIFIYPIKSTHKNPVHQHNIQNEFANISSENKNFLLMTRFALFAAFVCVGIFRSQLGIFYKFQLGFPESAYGWSTSFMCLFNIIIFWMMGKTDYWHYKKWLSVAAHASMIICMLMTILAKSFAIQFFAAGMVGIFYGFAYSSHQYYGVSGGRKRSGLMAIHEMIIGAGSALGAVMGGIFSDAFGRYSPYKFCCAVVLAAGIIEIIIWFLASSKKTNLNQ